MVMDFCQGGDLFTLMRRIGCMDEQGARLLGAEMALALQHLHDRDIVYRDLKPENVLLGADGHVKLTDFGLCRYFEVRPPQSPAAEGAPLRAVASWEGEPDVYHSPLAKFVTHSFCGTEEYMAPEVLLNQGHGSAVDWWCLGLCLHEMMARRHPFKGGMQAQCILMRG
jgi:serine/threonine protein kinase